MRERKRLESLLSLEGDLARRTDDIATYFDLAGEGENVAADLQRDMDSLRELVDRVETETLLSGENDGLNAIMTIHPGAGGTESQDWAEMLLRMYLGWAERQGFTLFPEAGFESLTLTCVNNGAKPGGRTVDVPKLQKHAKDLGFLIDGGYGKIKGTTFRISNMGDETEATMAELIAALDEAMKGL